MKKLSCLKNVILLLLLLVTHRRDQPKTCGPAELPCLRSWRSWRTCSGLFSAVSHFDSSSFNWMQNFQDFNVSLGTLLSRIYSGYSDQKSQNRQRLDTNILYFHGLVIRNINRSNNPTERRSSCSSGGAAGGLLEVHAAALPLPVSVSGGFWAPRSAFFLGHWVDVVRKLCRKKKTQL